MANTDGGVILQGVEDGTGEVTGLHKKRKDVMDLCRLDEKQAYAMLHRMAKQGELRMEGKKRTAFYVLNKDETGVKQTTRRFAMGSRSSRLKCY